MAKQEFVSNVTGEEWFKHNSQRWSTVINQVGIIIEDEIHDGKNGELPDEHEERDDVHDGEIWID